MSHADTNLTSTASIQEKFKSWQLASKNKINMKQMKRGNARPFLCTYSLACPPPHPWVDQGSDLAPTCSPCLSPHLLKATPLISFPLSDSSFEWEIVLRTGIQIPQLLDLTLEIQTQISSSASLHSILASKQDWSQHQDFQPNLPTKQLCVPRRTASTTLVFARNEDGIFGSTAKRREITANSQHRPKPICRNGPRVPVATNNPDQKPNLPSRRPQQNQILAQRGPRPLRTGEAQETRKEMRRTKKKRRRRRI